MSAFMIDDDVYAQLARFLKEDRPDLLTVKYADLNLDPVSFVEILRLLNRESIRVRYPDEITKPWMLAGDVKGQERKYLPIDPLSVDTCSPAQAARHLECIDYQSCETTRWQTSGMQDFVRKLADDVGGPRGDSRLYGKGRGNRPTACEDDTGHAVCRQTGAALAWGNLPDPPPPPPFKLPDGWDKGERKVMRQDTLRKLAESGRLELVDSYSFDDQHGSSRLKGGPIPVVFDASDSPSYKTGTFTMRPYDVEPCRQWTNAHGTFIYVRHHSNSNQTFRVVDASTKARAA